VAEIKEGLVWLWMQRLFRFLALLLCGINVVAAGSTLIIIVQAQHLHASAVDLGLIFSVAGMTSILGAATAPLLRRHLSFYLTAVCVLWPQSLLLLLLGFAPNVFILGIITTILFFFIPIFDIVQRSRRLALIPERLQGRINCVYRLIVFSGRPVSLALTGVLLQKNRNNPNSFAGSKELRAHSAPCHTQSTSAPRKYLASHVQFVGICVLTSESFALCKMP
jgi:hypothetical protein